MNGITVKFVRGDGRTFSIDGGALGLTDAGGLDSANVEVFSQKAALGDGDLVTGQRVGSRTLTFTARARHSALGDVLRRAATSFFLASQTYAVHVTRYGARRFAQGCRLDSLDIPTESPQKPLTLKLSFLMPEGYFLSEDEFGRNIAAIEPRCGYPFVSVAGQGRVYGAYAFAQTVVLDNDGDAAAFCKAVFTARGEVINPRLNAGAGFVRVLATLSPQDVMVVDGRTRSVTINSENASAKLDRQSSFAGIAFALGANSIGFSADVGANLLEVYVYYNKRYMGA
jgi:hypothetical protein